MRDAEEHVIDDTPFLFRIFPYQLGLQLSTRIFKIICPALGTAASGLFGEKTTSIENIMDMEINPDNIGTGIQMFSEAITESVMTNTFSQILKYIEISNGSGGFKKIVPDVDLTGKLGLSFKLIYKSLEVNFADFLPVLIDRLDSFKKAPTTPEK